jgi:hypothetical protein
MAYNYDHTDEALAEKTAATALGERDKKKALAKLSKALKELSNAQGAIKDALSSMDALRSMFGGFTDGGPKGAPVKKAWDKVRDAESLSKQVYEALRDAFDTVNDELKLG